MMSSIGLLASACVSLSPERTCSEALAYFTANPANDMLPVVEDGRPVGLIVRNAFVERFARPFHHELFDGKSCAIFMDRAPLIVDHAASIGDVGSNAATNYRRALSDGLIITVHGRYSGVCTGQALVHALADMQMARSRQILESVRYASRIQRAFLHTSNENLATHLPLHQILWEPRDGVGGDYYFCRGNEDRVFVAVLDCTGHGVPGALMTMIMSANLEASIAEVDSWLPSDVLASINRRARAALGQRLPGHAGLEEPVQRDSVPDDGMDVSAVLIDRRSAKLQFAGARLPMFVSYPTQDSWVCFPAARPGVGEGERDVRIVRCGSIALWSSDDEYHLRARSLVSQTKAPLLDERLGGLRRLSPEQIRFEFRMRLTNLQHLSSDSTSLGAGLGLLTIARNASRPIEYTLEPIDANADMLRLQIHTVI